MKKSKYSNKMTKNKKRQALNQVLNCELESLINFKQLFLMRELSHLGIL